MANSRDKRSLSDLRVSDASLSQRMDDYDAYRMMVLRFSQPEEEVDRTYLQRALDLGINTPQDPKTTLDLITHGVSSLRFDTVGPTLPAASATAGSRLDSRKSQSIHAPSDSSVESRGHRKTPSLAATSITSVPSSISVPSTNSDSPNKSNSYFKRGFKRFSTIRGKRKTLQTQPSAPNLPIRPSTATTGFLDAHLRTRTADRVATLSQPQSPLITSPPLSPSGRPTGRRKVISMPISDPIPTEPISFDQSFDSHPLPISTPTMAARTPPPPPHFEQQGAHQEPPPSPGAIERTLTNSKLLRFRTSQIQEQLRFISFHASQTRLMRTRHLQLR